MSSAVAVASVKPSGPRTHKSSHTNNGSNHQQQEHQKKMNEKSKRKFKHDRVGRKRSKSFSGCGINPPKPLLPTKFLLGGNINDPLNLNSLQDEEINRAMNAVTPKSSPVPTPPRRKGQIEVIIPPNIHDPLNLIDCADDAEYEQQLCSPVKKARKKRIKKRRTISGSGSCAPPETPEREGVAASALSSVAKTPETKSDSAKVPELEVGEAPTAPDARENSKPSRDMSLELLSPKKEKPQKRKSEDHKEPVKKLRYSMDKIVSPVVPQPGSYLRMNSINKRQQPPRNQESDGKVPQFKEKNKNFQYGNYNRYYGYRNPSSEQDPRLRVFSHHQYLFENKDILDIGCNIGHITLSIARDFGAKSVAGIDIDGKLIGIARKNVKHYVKSVDSPRSEETQQLSCETQHLLGETQQVLGKTQPVSGEPPSSSHLKSRFEEGKNKGRGFPNNVTFKQCNYILEDDAQLAMEQCQFDTILGLSITKWMHLNWGDNGIKQAFRRMYAQLRPGGRLILEPQSWASYKTKRKLTETIFSNFKSIEFFPDKFTEYLLSPAVGFAKSEVLANPQHKSKGFRRPIQVFTKSTMFPSERVEATPRHITSNAVYNDSLYQSIMRTRRYENPTAIPMENFEGMEPSIMDRYCTFSDDNLEANDAIGESLCKEEMLEDSPALQPNYSPSVEPQNSEVNSPATERLESESPIYSTGSSPALVANMDTSASPGVSGQDNKTPNNPAENESYNINFSKDNT